MFRLLLHKDVFFPTNAQNIVNNFEKKIKEIDYSIHINEHFNTIQDRSHTYCGDKVKELISTLSMTQREAFEIEVSKDFHYFKKRGFFITKFCVRIPYDNECDVVVVLRPIYENINGSKKYNGKVLVATAWMNNKFDSHFTLDSSKYCNKETWEKVN